jgi:hypothetical protein
VPQAADLMLSIDRKAMSKIRRILAIDNLQLKIVNEDVESGAKSYCVMAWLRAAPLPDLHVLKLLKNFQNRQK